MLSLGEEELNVLMYHLYHWATIMDNKKEVTIIIIRNSLLDSCKSLCFKGLAKQSGEASFYLSDRGYSLAKFIGILQDALK